MQEQVQVQEQQEQEYQQEQKQEQVRKCRSKSRIRRMLSRGTLGTPSQRGGGAPDETVILLHLPLPLAGVSMWMERECQQNDSFVDT